MMGGDVTVKSEPGKGAAFTVRLPARVSQPQLPAEPAEDADARGAAARPTFSPSGTLHMPSSQKSESVLL